MKRAKLYLFIVEGIFQIWEEIGESGFSRCTGVLNSSIEHSQELAEIIHKAISTKIKGEMPLVITISDDEVMFTRGNIVRLWRSDDFDLPVINAELSSARKIIFKGDRAIKFLNHFPYSYFEKAKNLAELYNTKLTISS